MNHSCFDKKKYSTKNLGTKPSVKKTIDKTELYPHLFDMYSHIRTMCKNMSKNDQENTGKFLYKAIIDANTHFALSYYHSKADDFKLEEAFKLLEALEKIKYLTRLVFDLNMLTMDLKHIKGLKNKMYLTVAAIHEQTQKWYN